jgi:chorismate mutase/prephenate dehydratase
MTETPLERLRRDLKKTDRKIVTLLNERADLSKKIGNLKAESGMEVYDAAQEAVIFDSLKKMHGAVLPEKYLKAIFREIIPRREHCKSR